MSLLVTAGSPRPVLARIGTLAGYLAGADIAQGCIGLATSLVVARGIGREPFGELLFWSAAASALTVMFDLGFGVWLTRETARGEARPGALVGSALAMRLATFVPVALGIVVTARGKLSAESWSALLAVLFLAGAGLAYGCISAVCRTRPEHVRAIVIIETGGALSQFVAAFVIAFLHGGVMALLRSAALIEALQVVVAVTWWRRRISVGDWISCAPWREPLDALAAAIPFAASGLIANAQTRIGPLVLGIWSSSGEVALFGAATRIGNVIRVVPHAAFTAALPVFAGRETGELSLPARAQFESLVLHFSAAAALVVAAAAPLILRVTYGEQFGDASIALVLVAAGLVPSLPNGARKLYLYATGAEIVAVRWSGVSLAIQLALTAILIPWVGAAGAAAALLIAELAIWWPLRRANNATPQRCFVSA